MDFTADIHRMKHYTTFSDNTAGMIDTDLANLISLCRLPPHYLLSYHSPESHLHNGKHCMKSVIIISKLLAFRQCRMGKAVEKTSPLCLLLLGEKNNDCTPTSLLLAREVHCNVGLSSTSAEMKWWNYSYLLECSMVMSFKQLEFGRILYPEIY